MNNNSGFGDINNCNSLNIGVVSSPTVNSIRRNSFYKLTNVLLLLFLVFGSCVVSFGMDSKPWETPPELIGNESKEDGKTYIAPRDIYLRVPTRINGISMLFLTKVMGVKKNDIKDKVDHGKKWVYWFPVLGLNDLPALYEPENAELLTAYFIGNIVLQSFYRGIFSVKPCSKIINEGGNCELYFGVGNVPYVGWLFNFSLVCKPTFMLKYLPNFLQDKEVTIHIIDLKPFNFILGCVFYTWLIWYTECDKLYIRPQWILGFGTVEINIAKYYNISLNVGSWIVDLIAFIKYTKKDNKKGPDKPPGTNPNNTTNHGDTNKQLADNKF